MELYTMIPLAIGVWGAIGYLIHRHKVTLPVESNSEKKRRLQRRIVGWH